MKPYAHLYAHTVIHHFRGNSDVIDGPIFQDWLHEC